MKLKITLNYILGEGGGGVRSYWANKKNRNGVLIS